jgi:hypothetical protein
MWRYPKAFAIVIFAVTMTFSASPAEAGPPCPYWILVSRDGFAQEKVARVCEEELMGTIVGWMRVVPGAAVSHRVPPVPLNDGFTVTIGVIKAGQESSAVLTVRVYPLAASGPVAFVAARTLFHGPKPFPPGLVVSAGWRSLAAIDQVPTVLTALGMLQPKPRPTTSTTPTTPNPPAAAPTTGSSRPGPDAVTLLFLLALLVAGGAVARRSTGRTRPETQDGLSGHSEAPNRE